MVRKSICFLGALGVLATACTEQHDPRSHWRQFAGESALAHRDLPKLTAEGALPSGAGGPTIETQYKTLCANCHGEKGDGKGPAGLSLTPPPRAFVDKAWQGSVNDDRIYNVIANGGAGSGLGLSPAMVGWSSMLKPDEIRAMVGFVRKFGGS